MIEDEKKKVNSNFLNLTALINLVTRHRYVTYPAPNGTLVKLAISGKYWICVALYLLVMYINCCLKHTVSMISVPTVGLNMTQLIK